MYPAGDVLLWLPTHSWTAALPTSRGHYLLINCTAICFNRLHCTHVIVMQSVVLRTNSKLHLTLIASLGAYMCMYNVYIFEL